MNAELLLQHFKRLSEAPDAIPRLRRFILDLAVRAKLVEQDPNDEPAAELLKQIQAEKARLVKTGKAGKQDPFVAPSQNNVPFPIPQTWTWVAATYPAYLISDLGKKIQTKDVLESGAFPVVDQGKVFIRGYCNDETKVIHIEAPMVLFGDHTRETKLIDFDFVVGADGVKLLQPVCLLTNYYYLALQWLPLDSRGYGRHFKLLRAAFLPLPPLAEQHRIVAKVDELMALCDQLEAAKSEREQSRDRLVAANLNPPADDEEAFRKHVSFTFNHLPRITTRPSHIKQLRRFILDMAVRGKLIPQDSNDEPAAGLIKRRTLEGKESTPFSVPETWVWATVGEIAESRLGKMLDKAKNKGVPCRYLRNVNVRWFDFDLSDVLEMRFEDSELDEFSLHSGDVLICEGGEPGRAAVWDEREDDIYFQKAIHRVRFPKGINPHYFVYALREAADSNRLAPYFTGVGIKHFTGKGLSSFLVPLPSIAEQHRIVAKVDELMALCDQLEIQLTTTQTDGHRLLEAVLHEALAPALKEAA